MAGLETLLIDRGDLASLAALAIQSRPAEVMLWHPREPDEAAPRRLDALRRQARAYSIEHVLVVEAGGFGLPDLPPPADIQQAQIVLGALAAARQFDCARIVWPRQVGPEFDDVAAVTERANLLMSLVQIGHPGPGILIDLPVIDLTERELVDLVEDTGAPLTAFWPCATSRPDPCAVCHECTRWREAFAAAGLGWPWASVSA